MTYGAFLRHLFASSWTIAQIGGDGGAPMPADLMAFRESVGADQFDSWVIRALDDGALEDKQAVTIAEPLPEPVADPVVVPELAVLPIEPEIVVETVAVTEAVVETVAEPSVDDEWKHRIITPAAEPGVVEPLPVVDEPVIVKAIPLLPEPVAEPVIVKIAPIQPLPITVSESEPEPEPSNEPKGRKEIKRRLRGLVWQYGGNIASMPEYESLLASVGLTLAEAEPALLQRVKENISKELNRKLTAEAKAETKPAVKTVPVVKPEIVTEPVQTEAAVAQSEPVQAENEPEIVTEPVVEAVEAVAEPAVEPMAPVAYLIGEVPSIVELTITAAEIQLQTQTVNIESVPCGPELAAVMEQVTITAGEPEYVRPEQTPFVAAEPEPVVVKQADLCWLGMETECGTYRIEQREERFAAFCHERMIADDMRSLRRAQEAVRIHYADDEPVQTDSEGKKRGRPDSSLTWLEPVLEMTGSIQQLVWRTACGSYIIVRPWPVTITEEKGVNLFGCGCDTKVIDLHYYRLQEAIAACEKHRSLKYKVKHVNSNGKDVLEAARLVCLHDNTQVPRIEMTDYEVWSENLGRLNLGRRCVVNVKEDAARSLLAAVGYKEKEDDPWSTRKVWRLLNKLPSVLENIDQPETEADKKLFKNVLKAVAGGDEVVVEAPGSDAIPDKPKRGRPPKDKAKSEKAEKPVKKRESGGKRIGVTAVLTELLAKSTEENPVSMETITKALRKIDGYDEEKSPPAWAIANTRQAIRKKGGDVLRNEQGYWVKP